MATATATGPRERRARRVVRLEGSKPKNRELLRTTVEDVISSTLVQAYERLILRFGEHLHAKLGGMADMYVHGGYALHTFARQHGLVSELRDLVARSPAWAPIVDPVTSAPRDVDVSVVAKPGMAPSCRTFAACVKDPVVQAVLEAQHDLRHEVHAMLSASIASFGDDVMDQINQQLLAAGSELTVDQLDVIDSSHIYIERGRGHGHKHVQLVERSPLPRGPATPCVGDSAKPCFPLRDSLNMVLEFDERVQDAPPLKCSFLLSRLALMVQVVLRDETVRTVPVNFLDVSIMRANDQVYRAPTARHLPKLAGHISYPRSSAWTHLPFPSLGYVAENTLRQLVWNKGELDKSAAGTEHAAFLQGTVDKLHRRIQAIALLEALTNSGRKGAARRQQDPIAEAVHALAEDVAWWKDIKAPMADAIALWVAAKLPRLPRLPRLEDVPVRSTATAPPRSTMVRGGATRPPRRKTAAAAAGQPRKKV
jgi:hypothetical protein